MSPPPQFNIDPKRFTADPYPTLKEMRRMAPIAHVPELGSILITRRDDVADCEKQIDVFSSHQPEGLMNRLMGLNLMRKDGEEHHCERAIIFPSLSPKTVKSHWREQFQMHCARILDELPVSGAMELCQDFAMRLSGECLKSITGLTQISYRDMDTWSQAMIDGIANYQGDNAVETRCHGATRAIDTAIDERLPELRKSRDPSLLSVMLHAGLAMDSIRANIKLAISGGQNETRDAIAGTIWALLSHPDQLAMIQSGKAGWADAFSEYARWISPIGMAPRRIAKRATINNVTFEPEDRVFLMFGSANRDESYFERAEEFIIGRNNAKSIPFGAGPHFCAGAWASRAIIAQVALPAIFATLKNLRLTQESPVEMKGWAFRGLTGLSVTWG